METPRFADQVDFPCAFECTSGEFLFGPMQCITEGMQTSLHDGMNGPELCPPSGTILQNDFKYRTAARTGRWEVSRVYLARPNGLTNWLIGYVVHHEDISPVEYVRRASMVGISNRNQHSDKGIVYVNRYDWSWHHGKRATINVAFGPGHPYTVPMLNQLMGGRLIVLDASRATTFIDTARNSYLQRKCYSLRATPNDLAYGIHLDCGGNFPEYELGWLGFSGKKHAQFPESDELVAIVYDPAYKGLELELTEALLVENVIARAGHDVIEDEEDFDEDYQDGSTTDSSDSSGTHSSDMIDEDELKSLSSPDAMPPPSISDIGHLSGLTVMISGSSLSLVTTVSFGDELASFKIKSNTQIEAYAPPTVTGSVGVKVMRPGGTSNVFPYTLATVATMTSLTPSGGPRWGGNDVVINGHHLERTTDVMFGDLPAIDFQIISDTQINATAPAGFRDSRIDVTLRTPYVVGAGHTYSYNLYEDRNVPAEPNYDPAITTWQRALNGDKNNWGARCELAEVYEKKQESAALVALWDEAVQLEPKNMTALDNLAKAYASNGNFEAAINWWKAAMQQGADEKHIFLGLANAYEKIGDREASVNMANEASRMWPPTERD